MKRSMNQGLWLQNLHNNLRSRPRRRGFTATLAATEQLEQRVLLTNPIDAIDDTAATDADTVLSVPAPGVLGNDLSEGNQPLTVTQVEGSAADVGTEITLASGALLTLNSDGSYDYDPNGVFDALAAGDSDTDSFTYEATRNGSQTDTATVTITINGVNDPPLVDDYDDSTDENAVLTRAVWQGQGLLVGGTDPDGDPLSISAVNGSGANVGAVLTLASGARVGVKANGGFVYNPNQAFNALNTGDSDTDSFTVDVSDGNGGITTITVTITINGLDNSPPVIADYDDSTDENAALTRAFWQGQGILVGGTDPDGDPLSISAVDGSGANVGAVLTLASGAKVGVKANGGFVYNPNKAFNALNTGDSDTDSFTVDVSDGNGGITTITVTITINCFDNSPPVLADYSDTVDANLFLVRAAWQGQGILVGGTDADGDPLSISKVNGSGANVGVILTLTSGAKLLVNATGGFVYNPAGAFNALLIGDSDDDTFTVEVSDGNGGLITVNATITVNGVLAPAVEAANALFEESPIAWLD